MSDCRCLHADAGMGALVVVEQDEGGDALTCVLDGLEALCHTLPTSEETQGRYEGYTIGFFRNAANSSKRIRISSRSGCVFSTIIAP